MSSPFLDTAIALAEIGGAILKHHYRSREFAIASKGVNDFVTQADRDSEEAIVAEIRRRHPDHRILAEEGGGYAGTSDVEWLIDPLDGTSNFMQGVPYFCVSVACRRGEELVAGVVYDPLHGDLFSAARGAGARRNGEPIRVAARSSLTGAFLATGYPFRAHPALDLYLALFREAFLASRGVRRCGAAALDLAYTAAGIYDGFFELALSPWDVAAGALLVREAGGRVSDLDGGERFLASGNVLAGPPGVHRDLAALAGRHASEQSLAALLAPGGGG